MKNRKKAVISLLCMICMLTFLSMQTFAAAKVKTSIKLNTNKITLEVGETATLVPTVVGKSQKVTWKSGNKKIATVSNGVITAKKAGKVTITAKANGKTAKCIVTVKNIDYRKLYKKLLSNSNIKAGKETIQPDYFYVLNIDGKSVPELIILDKDAITPYRTCYVYTVKNSKVVYAGKCADRVMNLDKTFYYAPKAKGIYVSGWTNDRGTFGAAYGMSGTKLVQKRYQSASYSGKLYSGTTSTKKKAVSPAKYNSYNKKYFSNMKMYTAFENTESNRIRVLGQ